MGWLLFPHNLRVDEVAGTRIGGNDIGQTKASITVLLRASSTRNIIQVRLALGRSTRLNWQGSLSTAVIRSSIEIFSGEYDYVPRHNVS